MLVILGPTSTGKTSLAIKLCKKYEGEIISADSRQVYKNMDIGTGKLPLNIDPAEIEKGEGYWKIKGVKIWGYDLVTPDMYFSAYDYAKFALNKVRKIKKSGKKVFLVGGTGFYIDAVTGRRKLSGVKPDKERRVALETTPTQNLLAKLERMNPKRYLEVDKSNRRRIIRALEVELGNEQKNEKPDFLDNEKFTYVGLTTQRELLYERADMWLESVWNSGLLREVQTLMSEYPNSDKLDGLVYRSVVLYLDKELAEQEAKSQVKYDLHNYIRKQLTYFRANKEIKWFDVSRRIEHIIHSIVE